MVYSNLFQKYSLSLSAELQAKKQNVDCGGQPEFVEGVGKPAHMFRQTQHDNALFGLVILGVVEGRQNIFSN
ncbi:MAG: hypothetical protein A3F72_01100 [Bacteroidetes bacterium RIFCSPLOWO2_12_FULL_35_15]|nr:MAG: hypothetical protein A3F72_01100 [Bacteroidetes bacterium RIFCSPLOWO2_12_FULL_35_15]